MPLVEDLSADIDAAGIAFKAGAALIEAIKAAIEAGNVPVLDQLAKVIPTPEVLEARDAALIQAQRAKAVAELPAAKP
jgi:hypothetical protein